MPQSALASEGLPAKPSRRLERLFQYLWGIGMAYREHDKMYMKQRRDDDETEE